MITFDLTAEITGLVPNESYRINVLATNPYTRLTRQRLLISCMTLMSSE